MGISIKREKAKDFWEVSCKYENFLDLIIIYPGIDMKSQCMKAGKDPILQPRNRGLERSHDLPAVAKLVNGRGPTNPREGEGLGVDWGCYFSNTHFFNF